MYKYIKSIITESPCYMANKKIVGLPSGIVIHGTGCENPWLSRWVNGGDDISYNINKNYFGGTNNTNVTPHAVAGLTDSGEIAIVQILPYDLKCWGCGSGKNGSYNNTHIQIEIAQCIGRGEQYCREIFRAVAEWCADLCSEFRIDPLCDIVSHRESHTLGYASNHGDPENWLEKYNLDMDWFRTMVNTLLNDRNGATPNGVANWAVQVGAFSIKQNADNYAAELHKKYGLNCYVIKK